MLPQLALLADMPGTGPAVGSHAEGGDALGCQYLGVPPRTGKPARDGGGVYNKEQDLGYGHLYGRAPCSLQLPAS